MESFSIVQLLPVTENDGGWSRSTSNYYKKRCRLTLNLYEFLQQHELTIQSKTIFQITLVNSQYTLFWLVLIIVLKFKPSSTWCNFLVRIPETFHKVSGSDQILVVVILARCIHGKACPLGTCQLLTPSNHKEHYLALTNWLLTEKLNA
jgi:hypothetical protein